ncbi:MAG: N-6 DNA methylase [Desulfurococcales archaeon]|jgi:Holliday junction resolvase|nr:N-6 DNA methylase [Desulfurococcales archaeon]
MSSSDSVTERSFYPVIMELAKKTSEELGVKVVRVSEIGVGGKYPDVLLELDGHRILVEVKIDSERKLLDDLAKIYPIATSKGSGVLLLLLPSEAKRIYPTELEKAAPKIRVKRGILLTSWASRHSEDIELEKFLRLVVETVKEFEIARKPIVDYTTIALVSRETIEELAGAIRQYIMTDPKLFDQAQAVIGRFDFYKSLLEDLVENEEIIKTYIADIMAYIVVLSLLFLHIASVKRLGKSVLPSIENPVSPPQGTLGIIERNIKTSPLHTEYRFIAEPLIYILDILSLPQERINYTLSRYIYSIQALKPEYVNEELLGRIYQEGLPPETRKNLGAFFTNPIAARLLAYLAIERWDEKVLDPACGSGTLLVSAYEAKMRKALGEGLDRSDTHRVFLEKHIVGIDVMQFAKELSSINLSLQHVETPVEPRVFWGDGIQKMITAIENPEDDPLPQRFLIEWWITKDKEKYLKHQLALESFDLVIMNPPFTRRERIPESERAKLEKALGKIVRGKVGYWAYFFTAADNVIKMGGKLAAVTPEEFFVGSSAESVRRYLLLGEVAGRSGALGRVYVPVYIVKSVRQVAFSEGASYRDYLVVFRKVPPQEVSPYTVIVLLKKRLDELKGREHEVAESVRRFTESGDQILRGRTSTQ